MMRAAIIWAVAAAGLSGVAMSQLTDTDMSAATCSAESGKAFTPALTPQQICDQFMAQLGHTRHSVRVALHFSPRGMASADATLHRNGDWVALPRTEIAVMDRPFRPADIDQLAQDLLRGLNAATPMEES